MGKIYINGRFLTQRITGVQRVAMELVRELDKISEPGKFTIVAPSDIVNDLDLDNIEVVSVGGKGGFFWTQWTFPKYARKNKGKTLTFTGLCPVIKPDYFMAHDITFKRYPKSFTRLFRIVYGLNFALSLKRCNKVFTVSEFSKSELIKNYKLMEENVKVIYNDSFNTNIQEKNTAVLDKYKLKKKDYFLSVSSNSYHKNQIYISKLARRYPDIKFVIVGGTAKKSLNAVELQEQDNLIFTGYLSDEELANIYSNARGFIFPSLYEGFGIPPLEAIKMGVSSVAVSNIEVFREVYPRGVYYFDPNDINKFSMQEFMRHNLVKDDYDFYQNMYSWKKSASDLYNYLKKDLCC